MTRRARNLMMIGAAGLLAVWSTPLAAVLIAAIVVNELDYLRASVRIAAAEVECWLRSLAEQQGFDLEDERVHRIMADMKNQMPPALWEDFMRDWRRVHKK